MKSPLLNKKLEVPSQDQPGGFGFKRTFYYHPGVDLYCEEGHPVVAIEDGIVVNYEIFTGYWADPSSPWWNETSAVLIEGKSGAIGYCELNLKSHIVNGYKIKEGEILGHVTPVLKKDKGNGTTMLHFELYHPGSKEHVTWHIGEERPESLLDPTELLKSIK